MSKQESGKVMKRKNPYMIVDVTPFRDTRLSWKAKGLMTYFLDKPDGWTFILEHIYTQAPDGETSVRSGLKELQKYGYLVRVAYRKDKKVSHYGFLVYEQPVKFPSARPIHVDLEAWETHLKNGGDIDITLFVENLKTGKTLGTSLFGENLNAGFLNSGKLNSGFQGLIKTNKSITKRSNNSDDDGSQSSNLLKSKKQADTEPQTDPRYQLLNQLFAVNGFDVAKKTEHQDKFFDTLREISFEKLMECATKYISLVRENKHEHAAAQIVWFLAGGYKNFLRQERPKKQRKQNSQPIPKAIREQLEEAKQQVSVTAEEDKPLSEEEFEEKRRRIMEKIRMMNEQYQIEMKG